MAFRLELMALTMKNSIQWIENHITCHEHFMHASSARHEIHLESTMKIIVTRMNKNPLMFIKDFEAYIHENLLDFSSFFSDLHHQKNRSWLFSCDCQCRMRPSEKRSEAGENLSSFFCFCWNQESFSLTSAELWAVWRLDDSETWYASNVTLYDAIRNEI